MKDRIVNNIYIDRLRQARIDKGLRQADMAKMLGYSSVTSYMNIEKAYIEPSIEKMKHISQILGFDVGYFFNLNIQESQKNKNKKQLY